MNPAPRRRTKHFDLIVLGAGPAGSSAAATAAKAGLSVALIDKSAFPREKLCGGGVTGRALRHIRESFDLEDLTVPHDVRTEIAFHAFGEDLGTDRDAPPIRLCMRYALDHALMRAALSLGARDHTGVKATPDLETLAVSCRGDTLKADILIAADGVNSPTAKRLFGSSFDRSEIGFALEIEAEDSGVRGVDEPQADALVRSNAERAIPTTVDGHNVPDPAIVAHVVTIAENGLEAIEAVQ